MMTQFRVLESLEIQNFRAFRRLQVERLGQVNLITGKNNVGKSCFLEALWVYAHHGSPSRILPLMEARDEFQYVPQYPSVRHETVDTEQQITNIRHLFHGRGDIQESLSPIKIGPVDKPDGQLLITVGWLGRSDHEEVNGQQLRLFRDDKYRGEDQVLALVTQVGAQERELYPLAPYIERRGRLWSSQKKKPIPCVFTMANGLDADQITSLWDAIALTDLEKDVLSALRIIAPQVERVTLVGEQGARRGRIPIIRSPQFDIPVPLRSMGEGMNRLLGIALALVNAQDGILLIDEIESGLHYSVQPDLWRLVFEVARRLNVQVFATTHSWDCVEAFQEAIQQDSEGDGLLISLRDKADEPGHVVAVLFDESELAIVTREQIEVR
jgi:hypothetical protein